MRKTILVVLMLVMVTTPSFAQEVETDGMFHNFPEGTLWFEFFLLGISLQFKPPLILPIVGGRFYYGYYQGEVYQCEKEEGKLYCPSHDVSNYDEICSPFGCFTPLFGIDEEGFGVGFWSILPIGIGPFAFASCGGDIGFFCQSFIGINILVDGNWTPATIRFMAPRSEEQATILTDAYIRCAYTTLQDDPPVEISFDPPDGLTVSNINVISNTKILFNLDIAVDAPVGERQVIVTYDDGNKVLEEDSAFEVLPRSN